jgi:hypothetical protein
MRTVPRSIRATPAVALMALAYLACGDNSSGPNTKVTPTTVVGSWAATSLTAPTQPQWGDAVQDDGLSVHLTLTSGGGYTFTVSNDFPADPWICSGTASCSFSGTYTTTGNTITFDEGTADEVSATYAFSPGTVTITYAGSAQVPDPYTMVLQPA